MQMVKGSKRWSRDKKIMIIEKIIIYGAIILDFIEQNRNNIAVLLAGVSPIITPDKSLGGEYLGYKSTLNSYHKLELVKLSRSKLVYNG